jgi:chaperonin GroEL (HSP60 family)
VLIPNLTQCQLVDISKVQDDEVGDGTTSVVVLACELLRVIKYSNHSLL